MITRHAIEQNPLPEEGILHWLRKSEADIIGFYHARGQFLIIGGPTGSYFGGHADRAQDKWEEMRSQGYLTVEEAKNKKMIKSDYVPPELSKKDKRCLYYADRNAGFNNYMHFKPWWKWREQLPHGANNLKEHEEDQARRIQTGRSDIEARRGISRKGG